MPWDTPFNLLRQEVVQRRDEGCEIPDELIARIDALASRRHDVDLAAIAPIYDELMAVPCDAELERNEPNDLAAIRALRPDGPRDLGYRPSDDEALDRFHGAWTGRAVGCALGKPVELVGMTRDPAGRVVGRRLIREYLERRDDWPLGDYFSGRAGAEPDGDVQLICPRSQREQISFMEPDDDIHYTLVALACMEAHGLDVTWLDIARYWIDNIPLSQFFTAEARALDNLLDRSSRAGTWRTTATPEHTRGHRNPFREWIGAQIRADGWAWIAAGRPELAAELAHRDASWTHERNGIYGEMMFAAMQAAAFVVTDARALVEIGLSEIPRDCRLAIATRRCLEWIEEEPDFEACAARVEEAFPTMSPVHTINNALLCVIALVDAEMHPDRTICTAVMCGHDTDCNGATVGSIVGAAAGRAEFGGALVARLHDTIRPAVIGFGEVTMHSLAQRTLTQFRRVQRDRPPADPPPADRPSADR